ncbi:GNAT family N-acetyltransferase [Planktotalea sp.]|uniref:GNAT family N-acetyltransferase n=1 Tax=Planktotalea sp. TaxID=2029877 RepID=UPI00329809DB
MALTFKKLTGVNSAEWSALRLEGARDYPLGFLITEADVLGVSEDQARATLDSGVYYGVFDGETLVGFCGLRPQQLERVRHRAEIGPFFVKGSHHGTGAASRLMAGIIDEARSIGIEQLELFVDTENHRAIGFYEKQGFERIAMHPDGVRIDGVSRNDYFYILKL